MVVDHLAPPREITDDADEDRTAGSFRRSLSAKAFCPSVQTRSKALVPANAAGC
jgi:hypothetical protein